MTAMHDEHELPCDPFVADCRVRVTTDLLAHTWNPVVLLALRTGPRRPRELRVVIGGISDKVLTQTLRRLQRLGLISRQAYAEAPPRVEYALTELGESLVAGPLSALGDWAVEHSDALLAAQARLDGRSLSAR